MQNLIRTMRFLGALAILAVGAIHLQQYIGADYRAIPTIGPLFLLNAIASGLVGVGLLLPVRRLARPTAAQPVIAALALAGVGIAAGSLVALFISETGTLFGFSESGYRTAVVVAIVAEAAAILLLAPVAVTSLAGRAARKRQTEDRGRLRAPAAPSGL